MNGQGADIFSALMQNPQLVESVMTILPSILGTMAKKSTVTDEGGESSEKEEGQVKAPDTSALFSSLLSNPTLLSSIAPMISSFMGGARGTGASPESTYSKRGADVTSLLLNSRPQRPPTPSDRRSALLLALRPYMSEEKAMLIDTVVRVIEIMSQIK